MLPFTVTYFVRPSSRRWVSAYDCFLSTVEFVVDDDSDSEIPAFMLSVLVIVTRSFVYCGLNSWTAARTGDIFPRRFHTKVAFASHALLSSKVPSSPVLSVSVPLM